MSDGYRWTQADLDKHLTKIRQTRGTSLSRELVAVMDKAMGIIPQNQKPVSSMRPRKFRNVPVLVTFTELEVVGGHQRLCHTFDSQKEADYYGTLVLRRKAGELTDLRLQEPFALIVRGHDSSSVVVGEWRADFTYQDVRLGQRVVVDIKGGKGREGTRTALYALKKKIVEACHGITITEV